MQQHTSGADLRDHPPADAEDMNGVADTAEERADAELTLTEEFDRLVNRLVKDKVRAVSAVQDEAQTWRRAIFDRHDEEEQLRMYRELINEVLLPLLASFVKSRASAFLWDAQMTIKTVLLTWGDTVSDVYALAVLLAAGSSYATPMLAALIFAVVLQALVSYFGQREGALITVAALLGLKPLIEGYMIIFNIESEGLFDAEINFCVSRFAETGVDCQSRK